MLPHGFVENFVRKENEMKIFRLKFLLFSSSHLKDPQKTLEAILNTKITLFPGHIQSVFYQNILKILTFLIQSLDNDEILIKQLISMTSDRMTVFLSSGDVEAQERVCF
jgi:AP-3 complex subunit delta-1